MKLKIKSRISRSLSTALGLVIIIVLWFDILSYQKGEDNKVDDNRRTKCKKWQIDKIHTNMSSTNSEFFAPPFANSKGFLFKPISNFINHCKTKV